MSIKDVISHDANKYTEKNAVDRFSFPVTYVVATIHRRSAVFPQARLTTSVAPLCASNSSRNSHSCWTGINLTPYDVGDEFDCSQEEGHLLILEGWAQHVDEDEDESGIVYDPPSESILAIIDRVREGLKER